MDYKIKAAIRLALIRRRKNLESKIEQLSKITLFNDKDLYFKANWYDFYYPECPSDTYIATSLEEAVNWLSKQSHPMEFTNCSMTIEMYFDIIDKPTLIECYDAEKLVRAKRANIPY